MERLDLSPRDVGRVLDDAIGVYMANIKRIVTMAAVVLFPVALVYGLAQSFLFRGVFDIFSTLATSSASLPDSAMGALLVADALAGASSLAWLLARVYFDGTIYHSGSVLLARRPPAAGQMLRDGLRVLMPVLLVSFIVTTVISAAAVATFWALGAGGIILAVYLAVAVPAVAVEGGDIVGSIRRSFTLVRGNFWRVVLVYAGMMVLATQIEGALSSPIVIRGVVTSLQHPQALMTQLPIAWRVFEGLFTAASMVLVLPFIELTWFVCYLDLRARNEGLDLLVRAQDLAADA